MKKKLLVELKEQTHEFVTAVVQHRMGHYCGYVGIHPASPVYYVEEEELDKLVRVHGGITYDGIQSEENNHYPTLDSKYDQYRFVGFDTAHVGDLPDVLALAKKGVEEEYIENAEKYLDMYEGEDYYTVKDQFFAVNETVELYEQIQKLNAALERDEHEGIIS